MKNIHSGHRDRLRKLAHNVGLNKMQEHQALELLLTYVIPQRDVNPLAHALINKFGSFSGVLDASKEDLMTVKGVGEKTAYFLSGLKDFFFLYKENKLDAKQTIKNTKDAVDFISHVLTDKLHEEMYVICIDGLNNVKKCELINKGNSNSVSINIRKITEIVLSSNTHNIILCHNHPNGSSKPSLADDKLTKTLLTSLTLNNIHFLDHIIIGSDDFYSYYLSGKLEMYKREIKHLFSYDSVMQNACEYNKKV